MQNLYGDVHGLGMVSFALIISAITLCSKLTTNDAALRIACLTLFNHSEFLVDSESHPDVFQEYELIYLKQCCLSSAVEI